MEATAVSSPGAGRNGMKLRPVDCSLWVVMASMILVPLSKCLVFVGLFGLGRELLRPFGVGSLQGLCHCRKGLISMVRDCGLEPYITWPKRKLEGGEKAKLDSCKRGRKA